MVKLSSTASQKPGRQEIESAASFVDILKEKEITGLTESLWLSASFCMARRGVLPANLSKSGSAFLSSIESKLLLDSSPLALSVGQYLNELETGLESGLSLKAEQLKETFTSHSNIFHCLLPAWLFQLVCLDKQSYSKARLSRSIDELGRLTQWFTPSWIASHLAQEVITPEGGYFLDPACGAGHLLVEAMKTRFQNGVMPCESVKELVGIDIDLELIKLAALSIYLCALDLNDNAPDPNLEVPALYVIEGEKKHFGSLLLATDSADGLQLRRFDEKIFPSSSLPKQFMSIAANPPYLGYRLMPKDMVAFLRKNFYGSHYDLYAAFLDLGTRLLCQDGKLSFICQQSFLSITRYESLRKKLLQNFQFNSIITLGSGAFETRSGEKVSSVIVTLKRSQKEYDMHHIDLRHPDQKKLARKSGIAALENNRIKGSQLLKVSGQVAGTPVLPDCPPEIASLFAEFLPIEHESHRIAVTNGLFTCDNKRFVKHISEVNPDEQHFYVPYDKGGGQKWFAHSPYLLWWQDQGESIRRLRVERGQSRSLPGEEFYFKSGITYSYIGTKGFKARLLSPNSVFDIASSSLFCLPESKIDLNYLLGFLNSSLVVFILGQLNPTINFQIGDIRRIPFKPPSQDISIEMVKLVLQAIELATQYEKTISDSFSYDNLKLLNNDERLLQERINSLVYELYAVSSKTRKQIEENYWVKNSSQAAFKRTQISSTAFASAPGTVG